MNWVFMTAFVLGAVLLVTVLVVFLWKSVRVEKEVMKEAFMDALKTDGPYRTPEWYEAQWEIFYAKIEYGDRPARKDSGK